MRRRRDVWREEEMREDDDDWSYSQVKEGPGENEYR